MGISCRPTMSLGSRPVVTAFANSCYLTFTLSIFRIFELKRFFTEFSVRPVRSSAMSCHLGPCILWASNMSLSSSTVHCPFLLLGSNTFTQRSLHYLPLLVATNLLHYVHRFAPNFETQSRRLSSSASVQGPLVIPGRRILFQRCRHYKGDLPEISFAVIFQFFSPYYLMHSRSL